MKPILLSPMFYGKYCIVQLPNGKQYRRVVRYSRADGLYIIIANVKYFEYEMEIDNSLFMGGDKNRQDK